MAIKRLILKPEREMRKIDKEIAKKIIFESKDNFKKTIEESFKAEGITESEFFLLVALDNIAKALSKIG